jgi:hypothetical protein
MNSDDLTYLICRANKEGARGNRIINVILPTSATQNITDTLFIVDRSLQPTTERLWYE